jgi:hypothetical protein
MAKGEGSLSSSGLIDLSGLLEIPDNTTKESQAEGDKAKPAEPKVIGTDGKADLYEDGSFELKTTVEETQEPEEKPEVTPEKIEKPPKADDSSPSSPYLAFARYSAEGGIFKDFSEEDWAKLVEEHGEDGALLELNRATIEEEVSRQVEEYKKTLSDEDRVIFESKINGLPLDEMGEITYYKSKFASFTEESLDDEALQEEIIKHDLKLKGNTDEDIKDTIDAFKDTDRLKAKAKAAVPNIVKYYSNREQQIKRDLEIKKQEQETQYKQEAERMKLFIESIDEVVPGLKVSKQQKEKLFGLMTTPVGQDQSGDPVNAIMALQQKNPAAFTTLLHYYYDLGLFNVDDKGNLKPDFSKITTKLQTKTTKETRKIFEANTAFQGAAKSAAPEEASPEDNENYFSNAFKRVDKLIGR